MIFNENSYCCDIGKSEQYFMDKYVEGCKAPSLRFFHKLYCDITSLMGGGSIPDLVDFLI